MKITGNAAGQRLLQQQRGVYWISFLPVSFRYPDPRMCIIVANNIVSSLVLSPLRQPPFFLPPSPRCPSLDFSEASFKCPTNNIYRDLYSQPNRLKKKKNPKMLLGSTMYAFGFLQIHEWRDKEDGPFALLFVFYFILLILFSSVEIGKRPNFAPGPGSLVFIYLTHLPTYYTRDEHS